MEPPRPRPSPIAVFILDLLEMLAQLGYLVTVFFSIFMSFQATAFLEPWKCKRITLAHH